MNIKHYDPKWLNDVTELIEKFHAQFFQKYDPVLDPAEIEKAIVEYEGEKSKNSFLLIEGDKCVGIISGIEIWHRGNNKRVFSENFFFVDQPYGRYAVWFIHQVERMLRSQGYDMFVMSVLEGEKAGKVKRMYDNLGFKFIESHYLKNLG
jgi:hypothetical protein